MATTTTTDITEVSSAQLSRSGAVGSDGRLVCVCYPTSPLLTSSLVILGGSGSGGGREGMAL